MYIALGWSDMPFKIPNSSSVEHRSPFAKQRNRLVRLDVYIVDLINSSLELPYSGHV